MPTIPMQNKSAPEGRPQMRAILSITTSEDAQRVLDVFHAHHIPLCYELRAKGTAPSEFLDILGLGSTTRVLTVGYVARDHVQEVFHSINKALAYHRRGTGIAVTLPLNGLQNAVLSLLQKDVDPKENEDSTMNDTSKYSLIMIAVNAGYSNTVVGAARDAGARGGTVIHGRRSADGTIPELGFDGGEEQEFVMIILPQENKAAVMQAITQFCGLNTPAHGVIVSLPVDEVMGLA